MSSSRHTKVLGLVGALVLALTGVFAGPAVAKRSAHKRAVYHKLTKAQKQKIRKQLRRQIHHNPRLIRSKAFIKKASLVNFTLPVTVALKTPSDTQNNATIDLGPSLGQRQIALSGKLPAVIQFHDTYDGGALGNVSLSLLPGGAGLDTNSIPLLWNTAISDPRTHWWASGTDSAGCGDFTSAIMNNTNTAAPPFSVGFNSGNVTYPTGGVPGVGKSLRPYQIILPGAMSGGSYYGLKGVPAFDTQAHADAFKLAFKPKFKAYTDSLGSIVTELNAYKLDSNPTHLANAGAYYAAHAASDIFPALAALSAVYPNGANPPTGGPTGVDTTYGITYIDQVPGLDSVDSTQMVAGDFVTGQDNHMGPVANPFPGTAYPNVQQPTDSSGLPLYNAMDTVLRTNALNLKIATPGTQNQGSNAPDGNPQGSSGTTIGASGGEANLFGNIPGKAFGVDVTANLGTKIWSIARGVDIDDAGDLLTGATDKWTAGIFGCHQVYTGYVKNYITGVKLQGALRISPSITADKHERIAKAVLRTGTYDPARIALSACLALHTTYGQTVQNSDTTELHPPSLPADSTLPNDPPDVACNTAVDPNGTTADIFSGHLDPVTPGDFPPDANATTIGGNVVGNGSAVTVAGDLTVNNITADVLLGDV